MFANASGLPSAQDCSAASHRLAGEVEVTPLVQAHDLGEDLGQHLWLKCENLQRTGSFKARGALNWVLTASDDELERGLITVSAGNHAMALAWAARRRDAPVTVVMPEGSSELKIGITRGFGAEVIVHGNIQQAVAHCHALRDQQGRTLVHPYNNARVMAGQGTVGLEILQQLPNAARILVPIGGGGLISGLGLAVRAARPDIRIIGVEPTGAATMRNAWDKNDANAALESVNTIAASLAPAIVGDITYAVSREVVDDIVTVDDAAIRRATRLLLNRARLYVETGAAVALAPLLSDAVEINGDAPTVLVLTGGNMDPGQGSQLLLEV